MEHLRVCKFLFEKKISYAIAHDMKIECNNALDI